MNRREFIKKSLVIGAGAAIAPGLLVKHSFADTKPVVAVVKSNSITDAIVKLQLETLMKKLGGIEKFIKKDDVVMIKPNIGWSRTPEQAANTNPYVVKHMIKMCYEAGAKQVKVGDITCNTTSYCYNRSGIKTVVEENGAEMVTADSSNIKKVDMKGKNIRTAYIFKDLIEADKLINIPIAKHHSLSTLTLGMKNWFGGVAGRRGGFHHNIHQSIVDMAKFFNPDLTIIDALRIMVRNGPSGGRPEDIIEKYTLIGSTDFVAADSYAAGKLFNIKEYDRNGKEIPYYDVVKHIRIAGEQGIGEYDLNKIKIV